MPTTYAGSTLGSPQSRAARATAKKKVQPQGLHGQAHEALGRSTQQAKSDIFQQFRNQGYAALGSLVGRGLSATTMLPSLVQGYGRTMGDIYGRLQDAENAQRVGVYGQEAQGQLQERMQGKELAQQRLLTREGREFQALMEAGRRQMEVMRSNAGRRSSFVPGNPGRGGLSATVRNSTSVHPGSYTDYRSHFV